MKILSAEQTRKLDALTIKKEPIKSIDLMERASEAFSTWFVSNYTSKKRVLVVAGSGNNGGDALAIARLLSQKLFRVTVFLASPTSKGSSNYQLNLQRLPKAINKINVIDLEIDVIIDGIFGSGISRPITGELAKLVDNLNEANKEIISIDIASGLSPDITFAEGSIIQPTCTISFQLPKLAFMFPENSKYVGSWKVVDIGLDEPLIEKLDTDHHYYTNKEAKKMRMRRPKFAHKGNFGHALIVGGSYGKIGANVLASTACLRSGTGLVTSLVPSCGYGILQTAIPEVMCLTSGEGHLINLNLANLSNYSAMGIGPGIGTNTETLSLLLALIKGYKKPMVLDADALNLLSQNPELIELVPKGSVLTPHIGEFNRLVGASNTAIERIEKQKIFSKTHQLIIVLKGAHSSVSNVNGSIWFNSTGNAGMATAGSGDVLTGIITALLAQGYEPFKAAALGVYLHGKAGDIASKELGEASVIASDIVKRISFAFISIN